jgi:hypothetical protein
VSILKGCKPRRDVLHGDLGDAICAADFGNLIAGDRCPEVDRDAGRFFANTHPAARLKKVVQVPPGHHAAGHKMSAMPGRSLS